MSRTTSRILACVPWAGRIAPVLIAGFLAACQTPEKSSALDATPESIPLLLSEGDVVRISFPASPEMSFAQAIQSDGTLNLPIVGKVKAAGKSAEQLQLELKSKYGSDLVDSNVLVTVEMTSAAVYVSGAVRAPRKVPLVRPMTVFEAVMEAGGFAPGADQRKVTIVRNVEGRHETIRVDLSQVTRGGTDAAYVRPYDTIIVGEGIF